MLAGVKNPADSDRLGKIYVILQLQGDLVGMDEACSKIAGWRSNATLSSNFQDPRPDF